MKDRMFGLTVLASGAVVLGLSFTAMPGLALWKGSDYWLWAAALGAFLGLLEMGTGAFLSRERLTFTGGM